MIRTIIGKLSKVAGVTGETTATVTEGIFEMNDLTGLASQIKINKIFATANGTKLDIIVSNGIDSITIDTDSTATTQTTEVTNISLSQHGLRDNRGVHTLSIACTGILNSQAFYYLEIEENNN